MKNSILETMKYCFTDYNQFLICETKTQAKSYLKQNSSINRIKDLKVITGEMRKEILNSFENFFHTVYDISSGYAVPLENEIDEADEERVLGYPNCPNCADQASIAAPGQTTLCKTHFIDPVENSEKVWWDDKKGEYISLDNAIHIVAQDREETCEPTCSFCESDKEHYKQMSEFFDEMIEHIAFHIFVARCSRCGTVTRCSRCGKPECSNVGIISGKTIFAFCVDCRDQLTLKQNTARPALERIGA